MEEPTTTTILLPPTSTTGTNYEGELKSTNKLPCQRVLFLHSDAGGLTISSFLREQGFQVQDENVTLYDLSSENCDRVINEKAEHMNVFRPEIMIGYDKGANVAVEMIRRGCFSGPTVLLSLRVEELTNLELPSTVSVVLVHGTQDSEVPITLAQQMVQQNDPLVGTSFAFVQVDDTHSLINITTSSQEGVQAPLLTYIDTAWKMKDRMATELLQKERTPTMPRPAPESVIAPPPPTSTRPGETSPEVTPNTVAADVAGVTTPGTVITNVEHLPIAGETVTAVVLPHDTTETKTEAPPSAGTTTTTEAGETTAAGATSAQTSKGGTSPQTSPTIGRKEQQAPKSPGKEGGNLHRLANAARKTKCTIQ